MPIQQPSAQQPDEIANYYDAMEGSGPLPIEEMAEEPQQEPASVRVRAVATRAGENLGEGASASMRGIGGIWDERPPEPPEEVDDLSDLFAGPDEYETQTDDLTDVTDEDVFGDDGPLDMSDIVGVGEEMDDDLSDLFDPLPKTTMGPKYRPPDRFSGRPMRQPMGEGMSRVRVPYR